MSRCLAWRIGWTNSIVVLTIKTHEGWTMLNVIVYQPTTIEAYSSPKWSLGATITWWSCSHYLVSIILKDQLSWTLLWLDLWNIFLKIWFGIGPTKISELTWRYQTLKLSLLIHDLLCCVLLCVFVGLFVVELCLMYLFVVILHGFEYPFVCFF